MNTPPLEPTIASAGEQAPWWERCHRALMPDYNRKAAAYWWIALGTGALILTAVLKSVLALPAAELSVVFAGIALSMLAGLFPVRIPRWKNAFTAGEIFIFLLLLLHGPEAAALAAAAEALLGAWRTSTRWTSRLASPAIACIAMYAVGSLLTLALSWLHARGLANPGWLLLATMTSALVYSGVNTLLTTAVFHLKRGSWPLPGDLLGNFGWIGITIAVSASVACLLFLSFQQSGSRVLLAAAPIIALLLVTLHYYFRQQEVGEAARHARMDAAEREARLAAEHVIELQASEQRFHSAFSDASIGMALVTFDASVLQANIALCDLLGFADEAGFKAHALVDFVDPADAAVLREQIQCLQDRRSLSFAVELRLRHRAGTVLWADVHGSRFAESALATPCLILQVQDTTARRMAEAELQRIAFHDSLTGLPNRHRFQQQLSNTLERARAGKGRPFGLMFLDFDRFKLINDSLGHAVGDEFLVAVARRIEHQLRPGDTVARLGGDEFAVLAVDLECEIYAVHLADRLLDAMRKPFNVAGNEISSSVSIGITLSATGYTAPADMLRDADIAMYKAKASGRARYALFDTALHVEMAHRMRLETDFRKAFADGQITISYQPMFELATGFVTGFEALARWCHPELDMIEPEVFVPVAEEAGLMVQLTDFVLNSACRQLSRWQRSDGRFADLNMHVNLSGIDVSHPNLVARIRMALVKAELRPQDLTLELTEDTLMQRIDGALPALTALRRLGIGLSVDDFGTGYSSLRHLSNLPVNELKIAPGFVADLGRGDDQGAIVRSIVLMAGSLGKSVVAEGIETAEQLALLQAAGCRVGQGHVLSRPLSVEMVDRMLEQLAVSEWHAPLTIGKPAGSLLN